MEKKWVLKQTDEQRATELQEALRIHPLLCRLLVQRGIQSYEEARDFFRTSASHLHDPFRMKGMEASVQRIHQALQAGEKILVYGDYDVDGTTAVAVVFSFFQALQAHISYYIPHRFTEGYGLSAKGLSYAIEEGYTLLITLDCGIKSMALIEEGRKAGIDTIVCDHHLPDTVLPRAYEILNPKQADCPYPYKELCGCGIAYKLISAYRLRYPAACPDVDRFLDLVATAIAADIVPITGENRTLCVLGLAKANEHPSIPLQALRKINALEKEFTISDLVFIIAPRVNAAGRMDDARKAVELFMATNEEEAMKLAMTLHENNNDRRDVDRHTTLEALEQLQQPAHTSYQYSTVVYQPHWHKGVVGIVASRLIDHHYRPTIVLTRSEGHITGSARSIKGFNLYDGLNACSDYLVNWGGHYFAAGLTMKEEHLESFRERFDAVVREQTPAEMFQPVIDIDGELALADIIPSFLNILKQFAPHGPENMKPIFLSRGVSDFQKQTELVKEKHIRFQVTQDGQTVFPGIGFNMGERMPWLREQDQFDILYHIEENVWKDKRSIQLKILDIR